jgi:hypothetical protein
MPVCHRHRVIHCCTTAQEEGEEIQLKPRCRARKALAPAAEKTWSFADSVFAEYRQVGGRMIG